MRRSKELLIALPWLRGATDREAGVKLSRGTERGPCLTVVIQHELQIITDLVRKCKMAPHSSLLVTGGRREEEAYQTWNNSLRFFSSATQYPLCREKSDAVIAVLLTLMPLCFVSDKMLVQKRSQKQSLH